MKVEDKEITNPMRLCHGDTCQSNLTSYNIKKGESYKILIEINVFKKGKNFGPVLNTYYLPSFSFSFATPEEGKQPEKQEGEKEKEKQDEEVKKQEEETKKQEEEVKKQEEEGKKLEKETKKQEEEIKKQEEDTKKQEEEEKKQEEEAKKQEEEKKKQEEKKLCMIN